MFSKFLRIIGLAKKSEVDQYKAVCVRLGQRLNICSGLVIDMPSRIAEEFDVSQGDMQEMHIDLEDGCSGLYHRFSPGVSGFSWKSPEELKEWVDAE